MQSQGDRVRLVGQLKPGQLEVIERVALLMSSKEIARELGISHNTVDQRIKRIQATLNVRTRAEAARLYRAYQESSGVDQSDLWGKLVHQSPVLPEPANPFHQDSSLGERNPANDGLELRQQQAAYFASPSEPANFGSWFSVLTKLHRPNQLTPLARTVVIALIMTLTIIAMGAIVSLAEGISRLI